MLFSSVMLINLVDTTSSAHKKIHSNSLYFTSYTNINYVNFMLTNHCITRGQPYENTVKLAEYREKLKDLNNLNVIVKTYGINIRAGRHKSKYVVHCLKNTMHTNDLSNFFTFGNNPGKLNFAITGTLNINSKYFDNITLAQGSSFISNNWWFGGKECNHYLNTNSVNCTARDKTKWCFTRGYTGNKKISQQTTSSNKIQIDMGECSKYIK